MLDFIEFGFPSIIIENFGLELKIQIEGRSKLKFEVL
jgi:hypothetical protein